MSYDDRDQEMAAEIQKLKETGPTAVPTCALCGSDKIILEALLSGKNDLRVTVMAEPAALIFKGYESEGMRVVVCGVCGYIHLFANNPTRLYAVYEQGVRQRRLNKDGS